jgi:hypothetical protein
MKRDIAKYDIYKLDNYLIKFGYILLIVSIISLIASNPVKLIEQEESYSHLSIPGFLFLGSTFMLYYGYLIRKKENRINSILRNFEIAREISVPELLQNSEFTEEHLKEAIQVINSRGLGYYVWNRSTRTIADGRLMRRMVFVDNCSSCGKIIGKKFPLVMDHLPECPYCGSPLDIDQWNSLKIKELDKIDSEPSKQEHLFKKKPLNIVLLIVLLIFFWPAAIIYIYKWYKDMKKI